MIRVNCVFNELDADFDNKEILKKTCRLKGLI